MGCTHRIYSLLSLSWLIPAPSLTECLKSRISAFINLALCLELSPAFGNQRSHNISKCTLEVLSYSNTSLWSFPVHFKSFRFQEKTVLNSPDTRQQCHYSNGLDVFQIHNVQLPTMKIVKLAYEERSLENMQLWFSVKNRSAWIQNSSQKTAHYWKGSKQPTHHEESYPIFLAWIVSRSWREALCNKDNCPPAKK